MNFKQELDSKIPSGLEGQKPPFDAGEIFAHAASSMVRITKYLGPIPIAAGSGFFVNTDIPESCEIVTSNYIANDQHAFVTTRDGVTHKAEAEVLDAAHDISIYRLKDVENAKDICKPLELETALPKTGEKFLGIGAAGDENFFNLNEATPSKPKFREGQAIGKTTKAELFGGYYVFGYPHLEEAFSPMIKATRVAVEGYTGGPWVNQNGKVIGLDFGSQTGEPAKFIQQDLDIAQLLKQVLK